MKRKKRRRPALNIDIMRLLRAKNPRLRSKTSGSRGPLSAHLSELEGRVRIRATIEEKSGDPPCLASVGSGELGGHGEQGLVLTLERGTRIRGYAP
jgi:hypothetical protein